MKAEKLKKSQLYELLLGSFPQVESLVIEGDNPFCVKDSSKDINVYIKNITNTAFPNQNYNVVRVQLPARDAFNRIKQSPEVFVFLGYDSLNDVFVTWNPYWVKQRLNVTSNVSFYSRLDAQEESRSQRDFVVRELNNNGIVLAFPREKLKEYIERISYFFPEESDYVAIGSKRRMEANQLFKQFSSEQSLIGYDNFLRDNQKSDGCVKNYCYAMKSVHKRGFFQKYKTLFLKYDVLDDYIFAIEEFVKVPEIEEIEKKWHNAIQAAMKQYLAFFKTKHLVSEYSIGNSDDAQIVVEDSESDWEELYTDENGKLTRIMNPQLLEILKPLLNVPDRNLIGAYNAIDDFYKGRFDAEMQLKDWDALINAIEWK